MDKKQIELYPHSSQKGNYYAILSGEWLKKDKKYKLSNTKSKKLNFKLSC